MNLTTALDEMLEGRKDGKHELRVMTPQDGDFKVIWDPDNVDEVQHAKDTFKKFKKKGMAAYCVKKDGAKAAVMRDFDPDAESMIMAPPLSGG